MEKIKTILIMMMLMMTGVFAQDTSLPPEPPLPPNPPKIMVAQGISSSGITAVVRPSVPGPYVKQNPVYLNVDYVPHNYLVTRPLRIHDYDVNGNRNRMIQSIANTISPKVVLSVTSVPRGFTFVKKRLGNTFFLDISEESTFYPNMDGAEVVR